MRGLKAAAGDIASRFLGAPSEKLDVIAVTGTNGKTSTAWWVAQALRCDRPALGGDRHSRHRRAAARGGERRGVDRRRAGADIDRPDHARPDHPAERARRLRRARLLELRDRGVVDRHRRASPRRHPGGGGGVHQLHPGPPRLPRRHGRLLAGKGAALRLAGIARGGGQPRRCARGGARRHARGDAGRHLDGLDPRRRAARRREHPLRPRGPRLRRPGRRDQRGDRHAADRRLQRLQPAGDARRAARPRRRPRRGGRRLCRADAGAGPDAAGRQRRRGRAARGRRRLRAHARCAGEGAGRAPAARRRARRQALVRVRLRRQPRRGASGR